MLAGESTRCIFDFLSNIWTTRQATENVVDIIWGHVYKQIKYYEKIHRGKGTLDIRLAASILNPSTPRLRRSLL